MRPFGGPDFLKNSKKCKNGQHPCAWCGKPVKNLDAAVLVFICCGQFEPDGGREVHNWHDNCMESYPLGPDCARKYRAQRMMT